MSGSEYLALLLLFGLPLLVGLLFRRYLQRKRRQEQSQVIDDYAKEYRQALWRLERSPDDTTLREKVRDVGRAYARVTRQAGREALFDEVTLLTDLMALDSGSAGGADVAEIAGRLRRLRALRERGAITADEYAARRRAILDDL